MRNTVILLFEYLTYHIDGMCNKYNRGDEVSTSFNKYFRSDILVYYFPSFMLYIEMGNLQTGVQKTSVKVQEKCYFVSFHLLLKITLWMFRK